MSEERWTPTGVRLRCTRSRPGPLNWLFLPGGPGIGAESLIELVETIDVPGTSWLVDLPGDGSNVAAPGAPADPYSVWPQVFLEAVAAVKNPVCVGHSTGGEYLLSVPDLASRIRGMALVSTAPNAGWMPVYEAMTRADPLSGVTTATEEYLRRPSDETLGRMAVESAPWNFTPAALSQGRDLLTRMPYNMAAVEWSDQHFDRTYNAKWWPDQLPTLVLSGAQDRIVTQTLWDDARYAGPNVIRRTVADAGHFLWIDQPRAAHDAFAELVDHIGAAC